MRLVTFGIALGWARLSGDWTNPQQFAVRGVGRIGVPDLLVEDLHLDVARVPRRTMKAVGAHVGR